MIQFDIEKFEKSFSPDHQRLFSLVQSLFLKSCLLFVHYMFLALLCFCKSGMQGTLSRFFKPSTYSCSSHLRLFSLKIWKCTLSHLQSRCISPSVWFVLIMTKLIRLFYGIQCSLSYNFQHPNSHCIQHIIQESHFSHKQLF